MKNLFFVAVFFLVGGIVRGQNYMQTLNVQIPDTLNFVNIDSKLTSYYELYLTNFSTDTFKLKKLSVVNTNDLSVQFISQNQDLKNRYTKIGATNQDTTLSLLPGNTSVIYVELSLLNKTVSEITHLILFDVAGKNNLGEIKIQTATTKCFLTNKLILSNPLAGGPWTAVYSPFWQSGHRRVIYTLYGKASIPGRYAIDFIKMDSDGKYVKGSENIIKSWFGYGADVLAVADGVVSSMRDDFSESLSISEHPEYTSDKATGNYISVKIGNKQFAFYEHLKPKSIKVKIGQRVKKGDIIASIGFTGQTTGPHLHFHVADSDSPLGAESIPFVFESFKALGFYNDFGNFGKAPWAISLNHSNQLILHQERPLPNSVIEFR